MATNPWVSRGARNEQGLYEDLVIESLKFYGEDVYYLPREIVNKDKVFLDDVPSRFSDAYKIEMYIENQEGFDGEGDLFSKFGVELRDQATFVVARRRWKKLIGDKLDAYNFRPREGDIIYLPMSQSMFEIFKVETETPFYQLSNLPTFRLQCELFEYNDEDFDTDVDNIDVVEDESAYQYKLTMRSPAAATATGTTTISPDGVVGEIEIESLGFGYTTAPTVTIGTNPGGLSKLGNSSLDVNRGRGLEQTYALTGAQGTVEMWVQTTTLPNAGEQVVLFKTGGSGSDPENVYFWGIDNLGQLVYSREDNGGGSITSLTGGTALFATGTWHHILIGAFDTNNLVIYFDGNKVLDTLLAGVTWNFVGTNGFSVGSTAARTVDGVDWKALNGYIDEFRVQTGSKTQILEPRYSTPGNSDSIDTDDNGAEWTANPTYDATLQHFNAVSATATATINTDGTLNAVELLTSGIYYNAPPTITFSAPYSGGNYKKNAVVTQTTPSYTIRGEVGRWSDSDNVLYLAHVGATDGKYHTFNTTNALVSDAATYSPSLVEELNYIQQIDNVGNDEPVAQNKYFDDFEGDFLDFSESNPFGDMS
jgi:hypothetical protein